MLRRWLPANRKGEEEKTRLKRTEGPRALDLGMGYGRNALWLAEQGYRVEGWEIDERYLREARREAGRRGVRLACRRADFSRASLRGSYDVIVISQALNQVPRSTALRVLQAAREALEPGGRLFLLAKLTRDRYFQRWKRSREWERVPDVFSMA